MTPNSTPVWPCGGADKCLCGTAQDIRRQPEPHPVVELDAVNHPRHYTAVQRILREHWPAMRRASATITPGSRP